MVQPTKGPRFGKSPAHEKLILANLARSLFIEESIQTTLPKAKRVQPLVEKLITFAKKGTLADRRIVLKTITDKSVVHKLFVELAPQFQNRHGGYTRITKTGFRKGDNAELAEIELILTPVQAKEKEAVTKEIDIKDEDIDLDKVETKDVDGDVEGADDKSDAEVSDEAVNEADEPKDSETIAEGESEAVETSSEETPVATEQTDAVETSEEKPAEETDSTEATSEEPSEKDTDSENKDSE